MLITKKGQQLGAVRGEESKQEATEGKQKGTIREMTGRHIIALVSCVVGLEEKLL